MAQRLAKDLADRGLVIVSGLARGIDVVCPKENKKIFEEMEKRAAIISRFPLGRFPGAEFPDSEPDHSGNVAGSGRCRRRPIFGIADHGADGKGVWPGGFTYPGKRDAAIRVPVRISSSSREQSW